MTIARRARTLALMSRMDQLQKLHAADPADADVLYMLAQEHAKAGDYRSAIAWYDRCLGADPNYLYGYFHKARAQQSAEDEAGAIQTLRTGLAAARAARDAKASSEIAGFLDELEG
jgi:tetratricopeptide (TPR) repeat protein